LQFDGGVVCRLTWSMVTRSSYSQGVSRPITLTHHFNAATSTLASFPRYPGEMGKLLNYNEGMARRIGHTFHFSDYIPHELAQIVQCQVKKKEFTCEMTDDDMARLVEQHTTAEQRSKLNGGLAEKLLEKFEDAKLNRFDEDTCTDNFLTTYSRDEIEEAFNTLTPNILEGLTSSVVLK